MKKYSLYFSIFILAAIFLLPSQALAQDIAIMLNNQKIPASVAPVVENSRVLVPVRVISENLGATVNYYPSTKKIDITYSGTVINLQIGTKNATVAGKAYTLDVLPKVISNTTLVPLRFVGESMGITVNWDNTKKQVVLTKSSQTSSNTNQPAPTTDLKQLEADLLTLINENRVNLGLNPLILVEPLSTMAKLHTTDMLQNNFFGHNSPTKGTTVQRALALGIENIGENLGEGYPDAATLFDAWINSVEHRKNFHAEDAVFIGLGFAKPSNSVNTNIYASATFILGEGFFTMARDGKIQGNTVEVKGYAKGTTNMSLFKVDPSNPNVYLSRKSISVTPGSDYSFTATIQLPEQGIYKLRIGNDVLTLDNR